MNDTLATLANAYLDAGTGSIMLYYDFSADQTGVELAVSDGSSFDASLNMVSSTWDGGSILVGGTSESFSLWDETSEITNINVINGNDYTHLTLQTGLDPLGSYGLSVTGSEGFAVTDFSISNTGTVLFARYYWDAGSGIAFIEQPFLLNDTYNGLILNASPSSTVGSFNGIVTSSTGSSPSFAAASLQTFFLSESSGVDLTYSNINYGSFSGAGFMPESGINSEVTYLFSFTKTDSQDGILFGSLRDEHFDNGDISFSYGRGFNIGVNDRNKLFFQGIDSTIGEYVVTANNIELANKNICSVCVSPYEVNFGYYNLSDDDFQEENLRTDSKIQNIDWAENFNIGYSPTYYKGNGNDTTFSGYIDQFLVLSGSYNPSDLKALSSGFVATGVPVSGISFQDEVITGQTIDLVYTSGITGYEAVLTGYQDVTSTGSLIEFTLISNSDLKADGERFFTGYSVGSDSYIEETSFLIREDVYVTTGYDPFSTLGLTSRSGSVDSHTLSTTRTASTTGTFPLYDIQPLTGILSGSPTGYLKTNLSTFIDRTGSLVENLDFIEGVVEQYRHDYRYYLSERV